MRTQSDMRYIRKGHHYTHLQEEGPPAYSRESLRSAPVRGKCSERVKISRRRERGRRNLAGRPNTTTDQQVRLHLPQRT